MASSLCGDDERTGETNKRMVAASLWLELKAHCAFRKRRCRITQQKITDRAFPYFSLFFPFLKISTKSNTGSNDRHDKWSTKKRHREMKISEGNRTPRCKEKNAHHSKDFFLTPSVPLWSWIKDVSRSWMCWVINWTRTYQSFYREDVSRDALDVVRLWRAKQSERVLDLVESWENVVRGEYLLRSARRRGGMSIRDRTRKCEKRGEDMMIVTRGNEICLFDSEKNQPLGRWR